MLVQMSPSKVNFIQAMLCWPHIAMCSLFATEALDLETEHELAGEKDVRCCFISIDDESDVCLPAMESWRICPWPQGCLRTLLTVLSLGLGSQVLGLGTQVLGHGLGIKSLALALKSLSLAMAMALKPLSLAHKSLSLAMALALKSLSLAMALAVKSLAMALALKSLALVLVLTVK